MITIVRKGWIVRTVQPDRMQTVPVSGRWYPEDDKMSAIALRERMESFRELDPVTYCFPYEVVPADLVVQEDE